MTSILDNMPSALLVIFRLGGLMIYGPVFGAPVIPVRIKALLSVVMGLAIFPVVMERLPVTPPSLDLFTLVPLIVGELLIGLIIGFVSALPLVGVQMGGLLMSQQMGLGFARIFNPSMGGSDDQGRHLSRKGRRLIRKAAQRNGVPFLEADDLSGAVLRRRTLFASHIQNDLKGYSLYVNVGGGVASLGRRESAQPLPSGRLSVPP